ncbi:MAG: hypothetical protein IKO99_05480 [Bacteroidales bacterium]|nr:hypothetical protein [Bacteroidales bacterium]
MKKFTFLFVILLGMVFFSVNAQTDTDTDDFLPQSHNVSCSWSFFSDDVFMLHCGYHYMFCDYLGCGGSVGFWKEIPENGIFSSFSEDDDGLFRLFVMPSAKICSPNIIKTEKLKVNFSTENGVMINRKFSRTITEYNNDFTESQDFTFTSGVLSYYFTFGVNFKFQDKCSISGGYVFSTLEYSKKANFYANEKTLSNKNMQGFVLTLTTSF